MTAQPRTAKGVPSGGQFGTVAHDESDVKLDEPKLLPLQNYLITGFVRKTYQAAPDAPVQPGSSCWHCGAALVNCVQATNRTTGETVDIGFDCADRAGLDPEGLKEMLAEKFADERARRAAGRAEAARRKSAEYIAAREAEEAAATAAYGEHGTESRFTSGCYCDECVAVAPHGTITKIDTDNCTCPECVEVALASGDYEVRQQSCLIDAETGLVIPNARMVSTKYGLKWVVDHEDGNADWYPFHPKRRSTMLSKGVLEASQDHLVRPYRRQEGWRVIGAIGQPDVDDWGEPIVRPVTDDEDDQ